eukprot:XP_791128.1 PREDICTED: uncharacterized protein LOC586246 isoform X1 [Strongylocentrotus purpuratus]
MPGRRGVFDTIMSKEDYMQPEQKAVPVKLAASSIKDPDELIECPYDKVHRIRLSRFPMHLLKCRKNYVGREMYTCPFNACHLVPAPEARHHIANCPDKGCVEKDMVRGYDMNNTYCRGYTKVPSYRRSEDYHHESSENWDEEIQTNRSREYWGPEGEGANGGSQNLPQAKGRGAPRAVGHTRTQQQMEMRLPRQPAQAVAAAQQHHQQFQQQQHDTIPTPDPQVNGAAAAPVQPSAVAGLGRGQVKGRVMAANLWGASQQNQASPKPGGLAQSSWGQQQTSSTENSSSGPPSLDDDDFPALGAQPAHIGLGRGLGRGNMLVR